MASGPQSGMLRVNCKCSVSTGSEEFIIVCEEENDKKMINECKTSINIHICVCYIYIKQNLSSKMMTVLQEYIFLLASTKY